MSLTFCSECQSIEGKIITLETDCGEIQTCGECGSDELTSIPEHDDYDMER